MQTQPIPFPLPSKSFAANGRDSIDLSVIPPSIGGRAVKVVALTFDINATPTLSSGTATPEELQKAVRNIAISDSVRTLFDGSFASMRLFEMLERGQLFAPEPDAAATTEAVNFQRVFSFPPPLIIKPSDLFHPGAAFGQGAKIDLSYGALTDVDANCTALTMTIQAIAWLTLADDVVLPPMLERKEFTVNKDVPITGEAIYLFLALCDSNAFGAITAGDFANFTLQASGVQTKQVHASAFTRAYHEFMKSGAVTHVQGEPRAATDDNPKIPNGTALQAATANVQPLIFMPPGGKISKVAYAAQNELVVGWSGSQASGYGLATRIVKRTKDMEEAYLAAMSQKLGVTLRNPKIDTESKREYPTNGTRARYMPIKFKY